MTYNDPRVVCQPWITVDEMCCGDGSNDADPEFILAASNILYARTCYRYPGLCERTVWPCPPCHCECDPCRCGTWSALRLPTDYPLISVSEVSLDGAIMDPADYRVDNSKWLVRMDGEHWPSCNSFNLPNSSAVEIIVTYMTGREVPTELKMAAGQLACELRKACSGDSSCDLPTHVKSVVRRGVSMELEDVTSLFQDGLTGNPIIDYALSIHGNCSKQGYMVDPLRSRFRGYGVS